MKYPNLVWALHEKRIAQFELAASVGISESKMSRAIHGRLELSGEECRQIADILGYSRAWLFRAMTPSRAGRDVA